MSVRIQRVKITKEQRLIVINLYNRVYKIFFSFRFFKNRITPPFYTRMHTLDTHWQFEEPGLQKIRDQVL